MRRGRQSFNVAVRTKGSVDRRREKEREKENAFVCVMREVPACPYASVFSLLLLQDPQTLIC